jgi:hypothetical protein
MKLFLGTLMVMGLMLQTAHANVWRIIARTEDATTVDMREIDVLPNAQQCYASRGSLFSTFVKVVQKKIEKGEVYHGTVSDIDHTTASFVYTEGETRVVFSYHCDEVAEGGKAAQ